MFRAIAGWKVWGIIFAAGSFVLFGLMKYIAYLKRGKAAAEHRERVTEARSSHRVAMAEADKEGAQNAAQEVEKSAEKAKTDNEWSRFTNRE